MAVGAGVGVVGARAGGGGGGERGAGSMAVGSGVGVVGARAGGGGGGAGALVVGAGVGAVGARASWSVASSLDIPLDLNCRSTLSKCQKWVMGGSVCSTPIAAFIKATWRRCW